MSRRRLPRAIALGIPLALGCSIALTGCTGDNAAPGAAPSAEEVNPTPDDGDESQDLWADLKARVAERYPDAEYSAVGSSARSTSFHLSPPTSAGTTGLAVAIACRGGGDWRVRVQQEHPRTIRGTCDGADPAVPDAIALDAHPTGVLIEVSPPRGTRFWMVAYYTRT